MDISDWLARPDHHLLQHDDDAYPPLLRTIDNPPETLYVAGDPDLLTLPQLAIVGSRSATPGGIATARQFASHLSGCGLTITSGMAMGVDAAAHSGALAAAGGTVAVLGCGPDVVYPRRNEALYHEILARGVIVSEFPPGTDARRAYFPQRNRIIAGLSLGTLVVEAGVQSGSLITARLAAEAGREVFAIPGSIHNPLSKGCHRLIRQGAKLVEQAADIIEEIGNLARAMTPESQPDMYRSDKDRYRTTATAPATAGEPDHEHAELLRIMGHDPVSIDALTRVSGLTAEELSSMLLILELQGRVASLPGGRFQQMANTEPNA